VSWSWVIALAILCFGLYEQATRILDKEMNLLKEQIEQIANEKTKLLSLQEELKSEIQSQNDPAWVELVLIRCLGLVPEGSTKVYFSRDSKGEP
jgi:hypothetical protein